MELGVGPAVPPGAGEPDVPTDVVGAGEGEMQAVGDGVGEPDGLAVADGLGLEPDGVAEADALGEVDAQGPGRPRAVFIAVWMSV